ncbi:MAG TPA: hypothetical protein VLM38_05815 [Blastocatellia bacterium]|nr:hypothetical protein [Blastocatellia bacterium]
MQSLTKQLPGKDLDKTLEARKRAIERLLPIVGGAAVSIVVGAVLWGIIYEIIIVKGEVLGGSIFLAFVLGLVLFALLAVYHDSLVKGSKRRQLPEPASPSAEDTAELLPEPSVESTPSITEHTTEFLMAEEAEKIDRRS